VAVCSTAAAPADGPDPGVVTAVFADASPLVPGFTVRSHGVKVGEIESLEVKDGAALVRMRIDESASRPLHTDATARIRPVSLLGERYIDFERGSPKAPVLPVGQPIDAPHTASAVDLSDVLNTVDNPPAPALAAFITTIGDGARGRGSDIDAALALLAPSLNRTDGLVETAQRAERRADRHDRQHPRRWPARWPRRTVETSTACSSRPNCCCAPPPPTSERCRPP